MPSDKSYDDYQWIDRKGSSYDLTYLRRQADQLIRLHLDETIKSFQYIDTGYNNLIFFIDTVENSQQYVLKVGGRYWVKSKTEDEVKVLELLAEYTTIPVPRVLAYSLDSNNGFGVGWILMTRLPGESMLKICEKRGLSFNAIQSIIQDLAEYVSQMHCNIPRMQQIGSFRLNGKIGVDSNGMGPWSTYEQYVRDRARLQLKTIETHPSLASIKDDLLCAMDEFDRLNFACFQNLPFVFSHGDLHIQNILISVDDPDAPRVTGIVDWEWSGSLPCSEEYFVSFNYFRNHENAAVPQSFYDELERYGVPTPRTIEHFPLIEKINRFVTTLALWDLPNLSDPDDPIVMKKTERIRSTVLSLIAELKSELAPPTEKLTICHTSG